MKWVPKQLPTVCSHANMKSLVNECSVDSNPALSYNVTPECVDGHKSSSEKGWKAATKFSRKVMVNDVLLSGNSRGFALLLEYELNDLV